MIVCDGEQGTQEWLFDRLGKPSASNFDKILTPAKMEISKAREAYLYELCSDMISGEIKESYKSFDMLRGNEKEADAVSAYEFLHDCEIQRVGFCLTDDGRYGASPDGLIGENGGVEIKCPKLITHHGYVKDNVLPRDYKLQVLGNLLVTGREWWDFMSYFPNIKPFIIRVYAKDYKDDLTLLACELERFCDDLSELNRTLTNA